MKHMQRFKPWFRLIVEKGEGESGNLAGPVFRHQQQRAGLGESLAHFGQMDASVEKWMQYGRPEKGAVGVLPVADFDVSDALKIRGCAVTD